jgi:hypothetical protein
VRWKSRLCRPAMAQIPALQVARHCALERFVRQSACHPEASSTAEGSMYF